MRKVLKYTLLCLAVALAFTSCSRGGKVIPRSKMAVIYAEMFVADQLILQDNELRRMADTTLVYDPILEKYGYTADDYRASVSYYIKDPDRYARILRNTGVILEKQLKELKEEKARMESLLKLHDEISDFAPERIYALTGLGNPDLCVTDSLLFYVDSTGGEYFFDTREWLDTAFYGPMMFTKDTVAVADTIGTKIGDIVAGGDVTFDSNGTPQMQLDIVDHRRDVRPEVRKDVPVLERRKLRNEP